ncbi:hypothetical protein APR04_000002 [Promicromonospora umidemergens]|nr:hypothetical protein [Promicromonospora umidemergens]
MDREQTRAPERPTRRLAQHTDAVIAAVLAAILGGVATAWGEDLIGSDSPDPGSSELEAQVRDLGTTNDQLEDELAALRDQNSSLDRELDDLDEQNQELREENERLRSEADDGAAPQEPDGDGDAPEKAAGDPPGAVVLDIRRQTDSPVQVMLHSCLDLDSTSADWGAASVFQDLCYGDAGVEGVRLTVMSSTPSRADCEALTTWQQTISHDAVVEGMHLCVQTNQRRTAYARLAALDRSAETVAFDIVVWEPT